MVIGIAPLFAFAKPPSARHERTGKVLGKRIQSFKTFITFNSNNTYSHADASGNPGGKLLDFVMPTNGSWNLKSGNKVMTLSLKGAGSQTVMTDFEVVEFKDTYFHITYTDTAYANNEKVVYHYEFKK